MSAAAVLLALRMLVVHTPDGAEIQVNADQITSLRSRSEEKESDKQFKVFHHSVHCMINLTDGKFITCIEDCDSIRKAMEQLR